MVINAYILAADPNWLEPSVRSYYPHVSRLVVCYDRSFRGWTDAVPIRAQECIDRVQALDRDKKVTLLPGDFARQAHSPMENDTHQRQTALAVAGVGADWVLHVDTDEVLPDTAELVTRLKYEIPGDVASVYWPLRPVFKQLGANWFLEVCRRSRRQYSEFPGSIAVRPGTTLRAARHPAGRARRYDVRLGADTDGVIPKAAAAVHFSWARTEADIQAKLASWGHSRDFDGPAYLSRVWRPAGWRWPLLYDFHPICRGVWPALRPVHLGDKLTGGVRTDHG